MTEKINKVLQDIIGIPMTRTTRAANMECLKFGTLNKKNKDGKILNVGKFGLHLQSPWRFTNDKEIIVGSNDLYEQADETADYDENFDWEEINTNLRDVKLEKLISENQLIVRSVFADKFGGLEIVFDSNVVLTIFPIVSSKTSNEFWRFIDNRYETNKHYLSESTGYDLD